MVQSSLLPAGPEPTMKDSVMCRGKHAFRMVQFASPEADLGTPLVKASLLRLQHHKMLDMPCALHGHIVHGLLYAGSRLLAVSRLLVTGLAQTTAMHALTAGIGSHAVIFLTSACSCSSSSRQIDSFCSAGQRPGKRSRVQRMRMHCAST